MSNTNAQVEDLQEGVHYYLYPDGRGVKHKVAILDHPMWCPRNFGTITLESFRVSKNSLLSERSDIETKSNFRAVKDQLTNIWFGDPIGVSEQDKGITWRKFPMRMQNIFHLENPVDRRNWAMISRDGRVEGSPNQSGKPLYKVIDSEKKNINYLENRTKRKRCEEITEGLSYEQLVEICPALGINAKAYSQTSLFAEIDRYVQNNFEKFLSFWDSPTRHVVTILKRALLTGVIQQSLLEGGILAYMYGNISLGGTESEAIAWLGDLSRMTTLQSITFQIQEREKSIHQRNDKVFLPQDTKSAKALKDEIVELKRQLSENTGNANVVILKKPNENFEGLIEKGNSENKTEYVKENELEEMRAKAKKLNIKGYGVIKNIETLKKKIAEAEALLV